ncbi:HD-GYP domain-containing protein [Cohnella fermenti]|uniref:HD domain-containing protein n=1 Tax=Cohnella fermenti TaxID=2565925 RepID=A0A4S4BG19_9BACL|nr:HD domain-containing phosphohydrolase [Cohnella fermenti]THF73132.1 HD domain-containing protein [Cohnella fermenti]
MRELHVEDLRPGDVVNKTLLSKGGMVMLEAGTVLTEYYIHRLRTLGFKRVSVKEPGERTIMADSAAKAKKRGPEVFRDEGITEAVAGMKSNAESLAKTQESIRLFVESEHTFSRLSLPFLETVKFRRDFRERVLSALAEKPIADEMNVMLQSDPQLFRHSLHVSLLSNVLGDVRGFDKSRMEELTLGSLLFDVGMTRLPENIVKANRKLTDEERETVRQHTRIGYKVLSEIKSIPQQAARAALLHHERFDGHGYPFSFRGKDIPELAQLVGLADIYDALLSQRHYRDSYPSNEAMEYLFAAGNYDFGMDVVQSFLKHVVVYPVSSLVELSNGQVGIVEQTANRLAHRPVIRIIQEANGEPIAKTYTVDLNENRQLVIRRLIRGL